jgi:hypothetical protein
MSSFGIDRLPVGATKTSRRPEESGIFAANLARPVTSCRAEPGAVAVAFLRVAQPGLLLDDAANRQISIQD